MRKIANPNKVRSAIKNRPNLSKEAFAHAFFGIEHCFAKDEATLYSGKIQILLENLTIPLFLAFLNRIKKH